MRRKPTCHVTVSTAPTVHTDLAVGLRIGGANTVRGSKGAAWMKENKKKTRQRDIRDIIEGVCANRPR